MEGKSADDYQLGELLKLISDSNIQGISGNPNAPIANQLQTITNAFKALIEENRILKNSNVENESRINDIIDIMLNYNKNGKVKSAPLSGKRDGVDALAAGLNILVEELESSSKAQKTYISNLEKSEEKYKYLIESVKDYAIYMLDVDGNIVSWNKGAEQIKGYSFEDIIGKNFSIFFSEEDLQKKDHIHNLELAKKNGRYEKDTWRVRKDGTRFWANIVLTALYDNAGKLYGFSKITRDITDRKKADEQISQLNRELEENILLLEEVNKELESFSYSVSHDLRAPLRAIHGYTNILFEEYIQNPEPEARRLMGLITYNAERMGRLVDDLLSFSQLGRKSIKIRSVNLNVLVESILYDFKSSDSTIDCEFRVLPMKLALADFSLISQVYLNLISNAIKYSSVKENPVVEIGSIDKEKETIYYIKDNGVGFDMKYYHKLFGVFQRLHKAREFEGTGVGLALVQRIITKHGGRVWADSIVGEGATFYFTL